MTREKAIKILKDLSDCSYIGSLASEDIEALKMAIEALEQEPRKGHWISRWHAGHDLHFHVCSECNEEFSCDMETGIGIDDYSFCPNCGADMREVKE